MVWGDPGYGHSAQLPEDSVPFLRVTVQLQTLQSILQPLRKVVPFLSKAEFISEACKENPETHTCHCLGHSPWPA